MKRLLTVALLALGPSAMAGDPTVDGVLADFARAKPGPKALAFYSLDWSPSLADAQARAAKERRPVFLIANTNITAGCNFYSGHT